MKFHFESSIDTISSYAPEFLFLRKLIVSSKLVHLNLHETKLLSLYPFILISTPSLS